MKQKQLDRVLTFLDEDAFLYSGLITIIWTLFFINYSVLATLFLYTLVLAYGAALLIKRAYYRKLCRKAGLQYFLLEPNKLYLIVFRKKLGISSQVDTCWRLHVDSKFLKECKKLTNYKERRLEMVRRIRHDMQLLNSNQWNDNVVLIGSTYAGFGKQQTRLLQNQGYEVKTYPYALLFFQKIFASKTRLIREQQAMFGKVYTIPDKVEWTTYVLQKTKTID